MQIGGRQREGQGLGRLPGQLEIDSLDLGGSGVEQDARRSQEGIHLLVFVVVVETRQIETQAVVQPIRLQTDLIRRDLLRSDGQWNRRRLPWWTLNGLSIEQA